MDLIVSYISVHTYRTCNNSYAGAFAAHGGEIGWDRRDWTLVSSTSRSLTFQHFDPADEGFPGNVTAKASDNILIGQYRWA
jgi:aldose 1-epimerase